MESVRIVQKVITREVPACLKCGKDASRGDKLYCKNHLFECQHPSCHIRSRKEWCSRHSPEYVSKRVHYNREYYKRSHPNAKSASFAVDQDIALTCP